jgi:hypothetical protein
MVERTEANPMTGVWQPGERAEWQNRLAEREQQNLAERIDEIVAEPQGAQSMTTSMPTDMLGRQLGERQPAVATDPSAGWKRYIQNRIDHCLREFGAGLLHHLDALREADRGQRAEIADLQSGLSSYSATSPRSAARPKHCEMKSLSAGSSMRSTGSLRPGRVRRACVRSETGPPLLRLAARARREYGDPAAHLWCFGHHDEPIRSNLSTR